MVWKSCAKASNRRVFSLTFCYNGFQCFLVAITVGCHTLCFRSFGTTLRAFYPFKIYNFGIFHDYFPVGIFSTDDSFQLSKYTHKIGIEFIEATAPCVRWFEWMCLLLVVKPKTLSFPNTNCIFFRIIIMHVILFNFIGICFVTYRQCILSECTLRRRMACISWIPNSQCIEHIIILTLYRAGKNTYICIIFYFVLYFGYKIRGLMLLFIYVTFVKLLSPQNHWFRFSVADRRVIHGSTFRTTYFFFIFFLYSFKWWSLLQDTEFLLSNSCLFLTVFARAHRLATFFFSFSSYVSLSNSKWEATR